MTSCHWTMDNSVWRQLLTVMLQVFLLQHAHGVKTGVKGNCQFPDFLQTSGSSWGDWMCKSDIRNSTHVIRFEGDQYHICTIPNNGDILRDRSTTSVCGRGQSVRLCMHDYGKDTYGVLFKGSNSYQCVKFIPRGGTVVQLAVDAARDGIRDCSSESGIDRYLEANFTLDEYPWISVNHFKTSRVQCPFTGGFNFQKVVYSTKYHVDQTLCDGVDPPIRVESDCVVDDGIRFNFRHKRCLRKPALNTMTLSHRLLCMATWTVDGDGFAILRNPNNDRHFYCLRVKFDKPKEGKPLEVVELVLFLDWLCYRRTDLSSPVMRLPLNAPYLTFSQASKRNLTFPCTDIQANCTISKKDCKGGQCMKTCEQCVDSKGIKCHFPVDAIGKWNTPGLNGTMSHVQINQSSVIHPVLGQMECVSFTEHQVASTRAILWGNYQNGCYPRFLCMHYDNPATSVMRYRLGDVLAWPLTLDDNAICDAKHFRSPPNIDSAFGLYKAKPWTVALRAPSTINTMPCVLPSNLPDHSGFVDQDGRRGCISLRSKISPYTISLIYREDRLKRDTDHTNNNEYRFHSMEYHYNCVAALTYKSVMTLTDDRKKKALCWLVVGDVKLVVINTSACNEETANGILKKQDPYQQHLEFWLDLEKGGTDLQEECNEFYSTQEEEWMEEFWRSQDPLVDSAAGNYVTSNLWRNIQLRLWPCWFSLILVSLSVPLLQSIFFSLPYG